jgi:hypothetical protein
MKITIDLSPAQIAILTELAKNKVKDPSLQNLFDKIAAAINLAESEQKNESGTAQ